MFWLSVLSGFVTHFGDGLAHGLALEFEAVGVMNDAVQDGIREGWFADDVVCQRQSKSGPKGSAKCCHFGVGIISFQMSASIRAAALVI